MRDIKLEFVDRMPIRRAQGARGIPEVSALALEPGGPGEAPARFRLWTLSDEKRKLYRLDEAGTVTRTIVLPRIMGENLEGLVFVPGLEDKLIAVQEAVGDDGPAVVRVSTRGGDARQVLLSQMAGFDSITDPMDPSAMTPAEYFAVSRARDGLEGIAWRGGAAAGPNGASLFLLKEKSPGLLLEIAPDLTAIRDMTVLNHGAQQHGYSDATPFPDRVPGSDTVLDFSDLAYDQRRDRFWILGDEARAVYLYDAGRRTYRAFPLTSPHGGLGKPEGLAVLPDYCGAHVDALAVANDHEDGSRTFLHLFAVNDPEAAARGPRAGLLTGGRHDRDPGRDRWRRAGVA